MRACITWLDTWGEEFVVSFMLALLILLLGAEVFFRFILRHSFTWIEELSRYLFIWSCYLGVAIAVKRNEQIRILIFVNLLEKYFPRLARICYVISELTFTVFCIAVFYYSLNMLENMTQFKQTSAALEIDVKYAYLIIPVSMGLTAFRTLQSLYRNYSRGILSFEGRED